MAAGLGIFPRGSRWLCRGSAPASVFLRFIILGTLITLTMAAMLLYRFPPASGPLSHGLETGSQQPTKAAKATKATTAATAATKAAMAAEVKKATAAFDHLLESVPDSELHPVPRLIQEARAQQFFRLQQRAHNVSEAADHYRQARGRHPPPGFDKWAEYALEHEAVLVESFFDRIYHDLAPFWAQDPATIAMRAATWNHVVRVRNGEARAVGDATGHVAWLRLWTDLVAEAAPFLPDVDMPINYLDESRVMASWEDVARLVALEQEQRRRHGLGLGVIQSATEAVQDYSGLAGVDRVLRTNNFLPSPNVVFHTAGNTRLWDLVRAACPPDSAGRTAPAVDLFTDRPTMPDEHGAWSAAFVRDGFVKNLSASADPCAQPHLRDLHGSFIEPVSLSTTTELIPLFGGCKLTTNNDILIPGAMYLTDDPFYSGGSDYGPAWHEKDTSIVWRGSATGGRNRRDNWRHFQRHRLVEMLNGSVVTAQERRQGLNGGMPPPSAKEQKQYEGTPLAQTFDMASTRLYDYPRRRAGMVGALLTAHADAGFTDLVCFPAGQCDYVASAYYTTLPGQPMAEQYRHKLIPDADGNSFSARFRALLLSTSLPLKATVYAEWHDDRLLPWLHFVPLDNTFRDLHVLLDHFLGGAATGDKLGDAGARLMAAEGRYWAAQVLRREDMLLYVWRLLLEFARVCDEKRDRLGYVADLLPPPEPAATSAA